MQVETNAVLFEIQQEVNLINQFTLDADFAEYQSNAMMRSAVERQLEIIEEAIRRLSEMNADAADCISERPRIISFRNQLIHGYFAIDDRIVWDVIQSKLPILSQDVGALLSDDEGKT